MSGKPRIVVGISGASGIQYGIEMLRQLREIAVESHLVVTKPAEMTLSAETDLKPADLYGLADHHYKIGDVGGPIASGSFRTLGMVVAPCSMKTLAEIAAGTSTNLLTRAADVVLKDRRRLVLMVRETPFHLGHLRAMTAVTEIGGIVAPPLPAFYTRPETIDDLVRQSVGRVLDLFGLDGPQTRRWGEDLAAGQRPQSRTSQP
jgi:flavin prenyltransferase